MAASKATRQLYEAAGLWREFCRRRDFLKAQGLGAKEAHDQADAELRPRVEAALEGGAAGSAAAPGAEVVAPVPVEVTGRLDIRSDVEWAYRTMGQVGIDERHAPTPGAWALRTWAKTHQHEFFVQVVAKLLPTRSQLEKDSGKRDPGRVLGVIEEIRQAKADAVRRAGAEGSRSEPAVP